MCGIFGIVSNKEVGSRITHALYDLQHRGEQAGGISTWDVGLNTFKWPGLITVAFHEEEEAQGILRRLPGRAGIGHTLYSTIGKQGETKQSQAFQPLIGNFQGDLFSLGHNGNLINLGGLRKEAEEKGYQFQSQVSDTEVIVALISTSSEKDFLQALLKVLPRLQGSFALTILFKDQVIGVRSKHGVRPLCLGRDENSFVLASEECAFHTMGASFIREIEPGEIIVLGKNGIEKSDFWAENPKLRICILEYIYFARPDSRLAGRRVNSYREEAGVRVAKEHPVQADVVCGVPASGEIYDLAVARTLGISAVKAIVRNRYFPGRTFITPRDTDKQALQKIKFYILREAVHGKRTIVTEDSIIRANASPAVVAMIREAGATEVHLRVGSAPVLFPCFLGIDIPSSVELVASGLTVQELGKKIIQVDSLGYLSLEGMIASTGLPRENLCLGCFTGEYPVDPPPDLAF